MVTAWTEDLDQSGAYPALVLGIHNGSAQDVFGVSQSVSGVQGTFVRSLGSMGPGETRDVRVSLPASNGLIDDLCRAVVVKMERWGQPAKRAEDATAA